MTALLKHAMPVIAAFLLLHLAMGDAPPHVTAIKSTGVSGANRIHFSPDNKILVVEGGTEDAVTHPGLQLWNAKEWKLLKRFHFEDWISSAAFSPNCKLLSIDCGRGWQTVDNQNTEGVTIVLSVDDGRQIRKFERKGTETQSLFSANGHMLAISNDARYMETARSSSQVELRDTRNWNILQSWDIPTGAYCLAFSPDDAYLAVGSRDYLYLLDTRSGKQKRVSLSNGETDAPVTNLYFVDDSELLWVSGHSWNQDICKWNLKTNQRWHAQSVSERYAVSSALSPDKKTLAVANDNNTVSLLNVLTLRSKPIGKLDKGKIASLSFYNNNRTLAILKNDGSVELWRLN